MKREIRIYRYLFWDDTSVEIEAANRVEARRMMNDFYKQNQYLFAGKRVVAEYVSVPCKDVTKKEVDGKTYIWVGFEASPENGWLEMAHYNFLRKTYPI